MKFQRLFFAVFVATIALPAIAFGQDDPQLPDIPNLPTDTNTTAIPFDGLTTILLAAGAGYAIKKGRTAKKRKEEKTSQ